MNDLNSAFIQCPYCGESFEALVDGSVSRQQYIEDCEVCCRPINFDVAVDGDGIVIVSVASEDE